MAFPPRFSWINQMREIFVLKKIFLSGPLVMHYAEHFFFTCLDLGKIDLKNGGTAGSSLGLYWIISNGKMVWETKKITYTDFWWYYIFSDPQMVKLLKIKFGYESNIKQISIYGQMNCDSIKESLNKNPILTNDGSKGGFSGSYNIGTGPNKCYAIRFRIKDGGGRAGIRNIEFFIGKSRIQIQPSNI